MVSRSRPGSSLSFERSWRRLADLYGNVGIERILLHRHHSVHQRTDPIFPHGVLGVLDLTEPREGRRNINSISCAMDLIWIYKIHKGLKLSKQKKCAKIVLLVVQQLGLAYLPLEGS